MGNIVICETKTTDEAYIFENTKVEVFSYEELCYYIYNNAPIISSAYVDKKMTGWIREKLELSDLADKLDKLIEKEALLVDTLTEILTHKEYYSIDEIKAFIKQFEKFRRLGPVESEKVKGDCFLNYKRYIKAIDIYDNILKSKDSITDKKLLGNIYHNRGIALANNLETEDAKISFLDAFTYNEDMESLREYFIVLASEGDESKVKYEIGKYNIDPEFYSDLIDEFEYTREDIRNMSIFNKVEKAIYNKKQGNTVAYNNRKDIILSQLKDEFREQII